jgi:hypothetical protein
MNQYYQGVESLRVYILKRNIFDKVELLYSNGEDRMPELGIAVVYYSVPRFFGIVTKGTGRVILDGDSWYFVGERISSTPMQFFSPDSNDRYERERWLNSLESAARMNAAR